MDDMYFINIAKTISTASKDPITKVGAIIVNHENRVVSTGYNGFISGNDESYMTFDKPMKHYLTIHAEMNAIMDCAVKNNHGLYRLYTTHSPCPNCLKHILQKQIRTIYYDTLYNNYTDIERESIKRMINSVESVERLIIKNINNGNNYIDEIYKDIHGDIHGDIHKDKKTKETN